MDDPGDPNSALSHHEVACIERSDVDLFIFRRCRAVLPHQPGMMASCPTEILALLRMRSQRGTASSRKVRSKHQEWFDFEPSLRRRAHAAGLVSAVASSGRLSDHHAYSAFEMVHCGASIRPMPARTFFLGRSKVWRPSQRDG
jgi:hypothetical protein